MEIISILKSSPHTPLPDQVVTGKFNALEKNPDLAHIFEARVPTWRMGSYDLDTWWT